jgi:hypothetical protein
MMSPASAATVFAPVFVLVAWTFCVLVLIAWRRLKAGFDGSVPPHEYALGESARVPHSVALPNRNYMNLLELPLLFYLGMLLAHVTASTTSLLLALAWGYVALRIAHSLIHITYNHVLHRFLAFAASNLVLLGIWLLLARDVFAG